MTLPDWFQRLPTPAKLLLLLSAALLPIGAALVWSTTSGIASARQARLEAAAQDAHTAGAQLESLIARNALALRIAANAALDGRTTDACGRAEATLAIAPGVSRRFELEDGQGQPLCATGGFVEPFTPPRVAPGDIRLWVAEDGQSLLLRTGVARGSATTLLTAPELRTALDVPENPFTSANLDDGRRSLVLMGETATADSDAAEASSRLRRETLKLANGRLSMNVAQEVGNVSIAEQLTILLPLLMWALAGLLSWALMHRLVMRPLRRLQRAVSDYQPGQDSTLVIPRASTATEIRELGEAFSRAVDRIDEGERQMAAALEGQRRLVREVHHRVKNNLQVVASLLSIHGRTAHDPEAKAAYSAIGRRVDALAVVHRNHFAELEENQGIQLRPMLSELATGLRASAPEGSRGTPLDLNIDPASTTQDAAVAAAFLITEVVEFAMLTEPGSPIEIELRRTSPLTARLTLGSSALMEGKGKPAERVQFDRIVEGLARQLRSPLEKKLTHYSVDLPVFPER